MSSIKYKKSDRELFALIDCNHFYVSCERAFRPDLEKKPVGILSNNDGCIVALSPELKKLGIERGVPYFKIKQLLKKHDITIFSSNYSLYGDMSFRVMSLLSRFSPDVEIYSIDEAFLSLSKMEISDIRAYGHTIRNTIRQCTGIPISVGIAPTKTLAKIANKVAKKALTEQGVFVLTDPDKTTELLHQTPVEDIWGIGYRYSKMLKKNGIYNAWELTQQPNDWIKSKMTIVGLKTVEELRGNSCLNMELVNEPKKGIISSKSFGKSIDKIEDLHEAAASYCLNAVSKLRQQKSLARRLLLYLTTNPFKNEPQYANYRELKLSGYSAYPPDFIKIAGQILDNIYREGFRYKKVGVMITDIIPEDEAPIDLFETAYPEDRRSQIMHCMDRINRKWGTGAITFAGAGIKQEWQMRREMLSPRYTTCWQELLKVKA
ncbi:MAG: Y-family DNA polymerase [Candidatus Cloacimonetes bacterium]|nr:Y-family DNA polymerase [Candidatus Cloacimonadota bacterium]